MSEGDVRLTTAVLGFAERELPPTSPDGHGGVWHKTVGGLSYEFRLERDWSSLEAVEALERAVFAGISDLDVAGPGQLIVVAETGGEVIGAHRVGPAGEELVGFVIGWGGYVDARPRILSDMLGVRADARGSGLGAELKKLQAAVARSRGFLDVVWTVDPLRAANARLNFEKLGAHADRYEIDRYGAEFAADLYGGLPTDRLHVTWPLDSPYVRDRLLGRTAPRSPSDVAGVPCFDSAASQLPDRALVPLPVDIDRLIATDLDTARARRLQVRAALTAAFPAGYRVVGFVPASHPTGEPALLLERLA